LGVTASRAREAKANPGTRIEPRIGPAVDVFLHLDFLLVQRPAEADPRVRREATVPPLEDEIRERMHRQHLEADRVLDLAAVDGAADSGVAPVADPRADLEPVAQAIEIGRAHV